MAAFKTPEPVLTCFIDGVYSPYASHSKRCPSDALFLKLKQKSSASRIFCFVGIKVDMVRAQRK